MASDQEDLVRRNRICRVLSQVGELHMPSLARATRDNVLSMFPDKKKPKTIPDESETKISRRPRQSPRRRKDSKKQKQEEAERAEATRKEIANLLKRANTNILPHRKRRNSTVHAEKLWFTLKKLFIQTAVFKSLIPTEGGEDITTALDTQKAKQRQLVQSSFDGSDYRDAQAKKVLGMYQDFLTEDVEPKTPSPVNVESKTKVETNFRVDGQLSVQTRRGIALLQKSLEHKDIVEADTMADKLCAMTISNPMFDEVRSKSRTQPRNKGRDIVTQVSKVNNYWASLVHRSDPHRLVSEQEVAQSRKADELRVRKAVDITQLPLLSSSPNPSNRRQSFAAAAHRIRRFSLPVRAMRGQTLPKLKGRRMSMAPSSTQPMFGQSLSSQPMRSSLPMSVVAEE